MNNLDQKMLQIKSLDRDASIVFSEYTYRWYVSALIEIGDGLTLSGANEHESTPEGAVDAYFHALTTVDLNHYIVTNSMRESRRHYRWNGAAFAEIPR